MNGYPNLYTLVLFICALAAIGVAVSAWRLFRYRPFDRAPVARDTVIENMPDGVLVLDTQGRIADANPAMLQLIGHAAGQVIGRPVTQFLAGQIDLVECYRDVSEAQSQIAVGEGESQRHLDLRMSRLYGKHKELSGHVIVLRDITEHKRAEKMARESEEKYRVLLEESSDPIFTFYPDGEYRYVNKAFADGVGRKQSDIIGKKIWDVFQKDEADRRYAAVKWVLENRVTKVIEVRVPRPDGDRTYVTTVKPIMNDQGNVISVICISKEITERKLAEEAEREQRALAEALRDTAAALNSTLDFDQVLDRILACVGQVVPHDAASIMLIDAEQGLARISRCHGYSEHGIGAEIYAWRFPVADFVGLRAMVDTGRSVIIPDTRANPDWVRRPETDWLRSYVGAPVRVKAQILGFMNLDSTTPGFFTPVHAERLQAFADQAAIAIENAQLYDQSHRHAQELEQQTIELQARNEELDAFAHTVAHDLKNPISLVTTTADLLADEQFPMDEQERIRCASTIARAGRKMDNIIQELLLLSLVRKAEIKKQPLDMAAIVEEARQRLAHMSSDYQAEIIISAASEWPAALGYGPWVEEVWVNYLSNAFKYGKRPSATPHVQVGATVMPDGQVRFWVKDNGPGIAPEAQAHLFTPFTRLDQARARGHGLGLSIVRRIVEKLDGQAGVESVVGQGCLFYFTLPAAPNPASKA